MSQPLSIGGAPIPISREDDRSGPYSMRNDTLAMSLSRSMEASFSLMSRSQRHAIPGVDDGQGSNRSVSSYVRSNSVYSTSTAGISEFMNGRERPPNDCESDLNDEGRGLLNDENATFGEDGDREQDLSSFGQTLFNACNVLMGVGLLSLPYAIRLCGWIGIGVLVVLSILTCYTAKILGKIQDYVPAEKLRDGPRAYCIDGFHDMGQVVFGVYGKLLISVLFICETFGFCCVFLIIEGENLSHQLGHMPYFESWQKTDFMTLSAIIFLPSCLLRNLSWLAYFSAVGVLSSFCLLFGVLATGLLNIAPNAEFCDAPDCTGSLYTPSKTDPAHMENLLQMLGLIMVGFSGHAVFPTLRNDMVNKEDYPQMVNVTYAVTSVAYFMMACCGYLMFGNSAQPEVTVNMSTDTVITQVIIWIVIVNPITKFALDLAPIALGLEAFLTVSFRIPESSRLFLFLSGIIRILLVGLALIIVISAPSFATVLGVMGSLCSFTMSLSFPCWCYVRLFWHDLGWFERIFNLVGAAFGVICAILGTWASLTR
eukprot:CAMPEP_0179438856 /NCGR_PEP_ID=MMETSP0799-20121207/22533_1 /TAXON_ID=46947 /ORGANISM="Geminigera cryophila, Strain CCMP2564" /LENGTH=539 /DNA_ID=CAMNT_0021220779 /DNA_START=56 /DNA_END=1675 /DNA_ORIENTATION=+